jgi:hypothetical protein
VKRGIVLHVSIVNNRPLFQPHVCLEYNSVYWNVKAKKYKYLYADLSSHFQSCISTKGGVFGVWCIRVCCNVLLRGLLARVEVPPFSLVSRGTDAFATPFVVLEHPTDGKRYQGLDTAVLIPYTLYHTHMEYAGKMWSEYT